MSNISRRGFLKGAMALSALPLVANEMSKKETLKFIHVTDSHMDLSDANSIEAMELLSSYINKNYKDLDFVLFGGDNFNNNAKANSDALKFKEIIDTIHCPSYVVRGNKESSPKPKDGMNLETFKDMFCSDETLVVQGKDWMLQKKGYLILGLDSCIEGANNGLYTKETINFAKTAIKSAKPTIILNHHPYTNYWGGTEKKDLHKYVLNNTKEVQQELLSASNVILTLSGHKHIDSVKTLNNTKMIVTRGFIRPLDLDMYPMRYVEITDGKISEKLIYTS
jgi:Icc protein